MSEQEWGFETRQIHAGASPDPGSGALALPIFQTAAYAFPDAQAAADVFARRRAGFTRLPWRGAARRRHRGGAACRGAAPRS